MLDKIHIVQGMPRRYIIASGHPQTSAAAEHAMTCGGNAVDGVVAGWLAACLAEPVLTSPGGGGFAMVAPESGRPRLYDFFAQTPSTINPQASIFPLEADFGNTRQVFHLGAGSVATPGCVAGILKMHADLGSLPLRECAAPALELSRSGLFITSHAATLLGVVRELYRATRESTALFESKRSPGNCLLAGETFHNPAFEDFLEMLVREGSRWFYEGDIGRIVSDYCSDNGGHLRREDFLNYRVELREPLEIRHQGATIWLNPPSALGGALIAVGLLSRKKACPAGFPYRDAASWQEWCEPLRLMTLLRSREGHAAMGENEIAAIDRARKSCPAAESAMEALFPGSFGNSHASGTTQISVIDESGNAVAMTTSNGSGSAIIPAGTGFMLNNMLGEEDLQPEGLGSWQPGRRLASMMCPTLARLGDGRFVATGSGGSNRIRSTILQILRHLTERGCSLEDAVLAPRLHWENAELHAETRAAAVLADCSSKLPWPVIHHNLPNLFFGGAHSVCCDRNGALTGIGDPRRGGDCRGKFS